MIYLKNRLLHGLRVWWVRFKLRGASREFSPRLPLRRVRGILSRNGLGFGPDGVPSWWLASLDLRRNDQDELTQAVLASLRDHVPRDARVLGTGCGAGWMLLWLSQQGFRRIDGFDLLPNVVQSAKEIVAACGAGVRVWQADGFDPRLEEPYDVILLLYWVYSAWAGNYGNRPQAAADRERLLSELLDAYVGRLNPGGLLIVELIDAAADQQVPPSPLYPVRHSAEQVARCAGARGLGVERRVSNSSHGHLPRTAYFLRKTVQTVQTV